MAVWSIVICCWFIGSVPLALLLGRAFAANSLTAANALTAVDDLSGDVDVFLERLFAS